MRRQIAQGFQAPVCEIYASTEFNLLAWSCAQSGLLHICDPTVVVEVLDDGGEPVADGETGRAVVTALHSRMMPFIRFELGDRVVKGPAQCPCGAPYGTLQSVNGREIDQLRLKSGATLHAYVLLNTLLASDVRWIRQYQLVQNEPGVVHLRVWPLHTPSEEVLARLQRQLEEKGEGLEIRMKLVDRMELDAAGKFHLCVTR
jgi:phenylacetate-CoA ligase